MFDSFTSQPQFPGDGWVFDPDFSVTHDYAVYSPHAALGPVSAAEVAAEQQAEALQAQALPSTPMWGQSMADGLAPLDLSSGWCGTNSIDDVWVASIVVWPDAEGLAGTPR